MLKKKYQYNVYQCIYCGIKETKSIGLGRPLITTKCNKNKSGRHRWTLILKK